ncbi:MAG: DNA polymerase III subunit delta [Persicimonas sp.]
MGKKLDKARNFFRQIKKKKPAPVYYVHGEETYMLDQAVEAIVAHAAPGGTNDFNYDSFHGRNTSGQAVVAACEQLPMMVDRRVVVLRDAQELPMSELEQLGSYLDDPADTTCLVVHAHTAKKRLDGRKTVVKKLKKAGLSCEFESLYENEVGQFLHKQAGQRDLRLMPATVAYLIEAVGTDLASLDKALAKIDLYIGESDQSPRQVDESIVQQVVAHTKVLDVFDLTDALGDRKFEDALSVLANMLLNGEPPLRILFMIARHFRIVAKLHDPSVRNLGRNPKARAVGVVPYFLKDYQRHANKFGPAEIEAIRGRLLEVDTALKSSGLDDRTIMEQLLYDICFETNSSKTA